MTKKILFIHHATGWGGAPINMINIIKSLDKEKFMVEVLLIKDSVVSSKLKEHNIDFSVAKSIFYRIFYSYYIISEAGDIKWYNFYSQVKRAISWLLSRYYYAPRELERFKCDIIHLNSSVLTDWLKPASKKGKVIYHIQEPISKGNFGLRLAFFRSQVKKYADHIIAISNDNSKRIGIPEKTTVIYNFATIPQHPPAEYSYSSKKILYLGGAAKIKGFYTLVDSLKYLDNDVIVYFGGNYPSKSRNSLKNIIKIITGYGRESRRALKKMRSYPNAIELGMIQNVDIYLDEVCCLVSPFSKPHFSRPVIEAYLHKKMAIGSDVMGMSEIIKHNGTGILFEKNDPKALANAINSIVNRSDKCKEMGERAYEMAIRIFSSENINKVIRIYNSFFSDKK